MLIDGYLRIVIPLSQIVTAGVAITAFSLLLYSLAFNLRDRVARSFMIILLCLVIVFSTDSFASATATNSGIEFWLRLQWVGIIILPSAYLHFSDALLETTGKPSRGRRRWAIRFSYAISGLFLVGLFFSYLVGGLVIGQAPAPYLQPNRLTDLFIFYCGIVLAMAWYNFIRAYLRTTTPTSQRRLGYLLVGAVAPALGSFPFLLYSSSFASRHGYVFWTLSLISNLLVGWLVVVMAYSVAFFGVGWPDRVVKSRLLKWLLRGPFTAIVTLALATLVRRAGEAYGLTYNAFVPITMVASILLCEYLITMTFPIFERWLLFGNDKDNLSLLTNLETRLLTRNDLRQFLEMVLAAISDRFQAEGAYIGALNENGLEEVVATPKVAIQNNGIEQELLRVLDENGGIPSMFQMGKDYLIPLMDPSMDSEPTLLGVLGITGANLTDLDPEQIASLNLLSNRAALALRDRRLQEQVFRSINELSEKVLFIQQLRAAGRYNRDAIFAGDVPVSDDDFAQAVKDALTHYWGGPKLTQSPLLNLKVVQELVQKNEGNTSNALRAVLREAIERVRPEGDRRFTAEWVLYNILEMKFLEGKKVREIAMRLAMSEADLYRKQRIAIEAVANAILDMEANNDRSTELH